MKNNTKPYSSAIPKFNLGLSMQLSNDNNKAREYYSSVIQDDPTFVEAYHNLSILEQNDGNTEQAAEYKSKAVELNSKYENYSELENFILAAY